MVLARDHGICALCGLDTLARAHDRAHAGHTWEMDHVVPVCEGGGECGLDGLRTLCIACHRRVTAELAARRARRNRPQQEIDL
jgi:5-methylcytosine-specific restriction endonuclease McrA